MAHGRPFPETPERVEKRTISDLGEWPYPKRQLVPLIEVVHDRLNVEMFRGCTRGCRFCQAGMITRPVRERPAEQVRTMVSDGLDRTGYDEVALTSLSSADYLGHRGHGDLDHRRPVVLGTGIGQPSEPAGRCVHGRHGGPDPAGATDRADLRPRGRDLADAPGDQQAHPRRGPLRRGGRSLQPGVAAGEALLPDRPAHRDRRGHPRASPRWPATVWRSAGATTGASPSPRRWAGSCPRSIRRSNGSGRTRSRS